MPKGIFEQGVIIDQNKFENSIIELLKSVKPKNIPTSYVHACLPETHTFIKVITIEAVKKEKLATAINNHNYRSYQSKSLKIRIELQLHKQIRKVMDNFSDQDWDSLLTLTNQQKVKDIMSQYSRDNPIPLITKLLIKEPRYLKFLKHLF